MSSTDKPSDSSPDASADNTAIDQASDQVSDQSTELSATQSADSVEQKPAAEKKAARAKAPAKPRRSSWFGNSLLLILLLALLGAAGGAYHYWQQLQQTLNAIQSQSAQQANQLNSLSEQITGANTIGQNNAQAIELLTKELSQKSQTIADLAEAQQTLINTSRNVFNLTHRNQRQWILAEASYLLSLANQRLIIVSDLQTAIAALTAANHRLHDLADPSLLSLRKQIAAEIASLKMVQLPDINGIALALDTMTQQIAQLPFKSPRQALEESAKQTSETITLAVSEEPTMLNTLWQRLNKLVTVRKHNLDIQPTETVADQAEISQQLSYRLETARLALINKNSAVFNHEISQALALVNFYYDAADNRVQTLANDLTSYSSLSLIPVIPDISRSWQILQQIIATYEANDTLQSNDVRTVK